MTASVLKFGTGMSMFYYSTVPKPSKFYPK